MKITPTQAKEMREVFGSCTVLFECVSDAELIADSDGMELAEYAWFRYDIESVHVDRIQIACERDSDIEELSKWLKALHSRVRMMYGIRTRR